MKSLLLLLTLTLTASTAGLAALSHKLLADHTHPAPDTQHAGRLDKNGGHIDRATGIYHYHR